MARLVANVDVITDTFEIWLLETNELLHALSTEIITANSTYANTGNSTFSRTAQLYGTFGANNLVVSNWMKGGNVNGSFANLYISTNTVLSNVNATEIRLEVANGSSNTFMWQYGLHAGLTGANLVANTTKLTVQSNSTTNSTANATLISVANSTISANHSANSFAVGISKVSNVEINVGANLIANSTALYVGNATINSVHSQAQSLLQNSVHSTTVTQEKILIGNSTINALANSTIITIANSTSSANIDPISFKTGLFTANTIQISLGANVTANATNGGMIQITGSATVGNNYANATGVFVSNSLNSAQLLSYRFYAIEGSNTVLANTRIISIANSTATANVEPNAFKTGIFTANTIQISLGANVTANATNGGTIQVTGSATVGNAVANSSGVFVGNSLNSSQVTAVRFYTAEGSNTALANTRIISIANATSTANVEPNAFKTGIFTGNATQMSVGANVFANATTIFIGNTAASVTYGNTSIAASNNLAVSVTNYLNVTGAMTVSSNVALANTLTTVGNVVFSNTLAVTGATTLSNTLSVTGAANVLSTFGAGGAANLFSTLGVVGATSLSNTLAVVGNTTLSNTLAVTGAANLSNTLGVVGATALSNTLSVTGAANTANTLGVAGAANLFSTLGVVGATTLSNTLNVVGAANLQISANVGTTLGVGGAANLFSTLGVVGATSLSNTLTVTGATSLQSTLGVTGNTTIGGTTTFKTDHIVDVYANNNLGATTGSDVLMFQFPKADYSSAKLLIQLKNAGNTQISEALIAHDTTTAYITTYGTVSSPPAANVGVSLLGTFSANVDTTNVRVYVKQTRASSAAKVVAQFIK